jgi:hypothetical protein
MKSLRDKGPALGEPEAVAGLISVSMPGSDGR